ncbi:MAG TPA: TetR/AcrR family transcriptional regulator [Steroidobacteraceae bacterium]
MAAKRKTRPPAITGHRTRVGQERRARTRSHIIATALQVFAAKGPDTPVIDDFIRAAGVARGTFYNYFTSTQDLLTAVSTSLEDDLIRAIESEIGALEDPALRLATGLRLWLRWSQSDPTWCGFVVRSRFRGAMVERTLQKDLLDGRKAGALEFASVEAARDVVVGTVLEAMHRILTTRVSRSYPDEVARCVLQALGIERRTVTRLLDRPLPALNRPGRGVRL